MYHRKKEDFVYQTNCSVHRCLQNSHGNSGHFSIRASPLFSKIHSITTLAPSNDVFKILMVIPDRHFSIWASLLFPRIHSTTTFALSNDVFNILMVIPDTLQFGLHLYVQKFTALRLYHELNRNLDEMKAQSILKQLLV